MKLTRKFEGYKLLIQSGSLEMTFDSGKKVLIAITTTNDPHEIEFLVRSGYENLTAEEWDLLQNFIAEANWGKN